MNPQRENSVNEHSNLNKNITIGLILGTGLALVSEGVGYLSSGHKMNDPIYFSIAASSLLRGGLLYFPWKGLSTAMIFSVSVGLLSSLAGQLLARLTKIRFRSQDIMQVSQITYITAVFPITIQEFGSLQVVISYMLSIWIGVMTARVGARISQLYIIKTPSS